MPVYARVPPNWDHASANSLRVTERLKRMVVNSPLFEKWSRPRRCCCCGSASWCKCRCRLCCGGGVSKATSAGVATLSPGISVRILMPPVASPTIIKAASVCGVVVRSVQVLLIMLVWRCFGFFLGVGV